ncbi:DUF1266 domain-containing protein [Campylobacter sp. MOP7]|uniref:DUF1266 domain-containing protein n=1 Tax=Campylobacter canis TaxID=3378588 RepID=UPI00387E696E
MNLKFIPQNVFQATQRTNHLDRAFLSKELFVDQFFSFTSSNHPSFLQELRQNLKETHKVTSKDSVYTAIDEVISYACYYNIILDLLYKAYEELGERLESMTCEEFMSTYLTDEYLKNALKAVQTNFSYRKFELHKENFAYFAKSFFGVSGEEHDENDVPKFVKFCKQTSEIYALCKNVGNRGYELSKIFEIISDSFAVGYINESEFCELMNFYAEKVQKIFSGWNEFIASCVLGGAFRFFDEGEIDYIKESYDQINAFHRLLNSAYDVFSTSGIWTQNFDKAKINILNLLDKYADFKEEKNDKEYTQNILNWLEKETQKCGLEFKHLQQATEIYYKCFYGTLKNSRIEFMLESKNNGVITPIKTLELEHSLYKEVKIFMDETGFKFGDKEFPVLLILAPKKTLITNQAVYIYSGVLFKKLKKFNLQEISCEVKFAYPDEIHCYLNEKEYFCISIKEYLNLTGKKPLKVVSHKNFFDNEISSLNLAINELKKTAKTLGENL